MIKFAKRLSASEKTELEELRADLIQEGYTFPINEENFAVFRVDGEIGISACELEAVFTNDNVIDLDNIEL